MKIQVVRHDGRAEDANSQKQGLRVADRTEVRHEAARNGGPVQPDQRQLNREAGRDRDDQPQHDGLDLAEAPALQPKNDYGVEGRDGDARQKRDIEQQVQCERAAQHLGHVARDDGDFRHHPKRPVNTRPITFTASAGKVFLRHQSQAQTQRLQQDRGEA